MESVNLSDVALINTIKEMLIDEEKIVTYVSLSKDLCIHINSSKILLSRTLEMMRREQPNLQLNINYVISGLFDVNMGQTIVCLEQDLDHVRNNFKTIFYEHIYSISKGIPNNAAILLLNTFEDFGLCKGYIKSSDCIKHSTTDISNLKSSKIELKAIDNKHISGRTKTVKQESNETATEVSNNHKESKPSTLDNKIKTESSVKSEISTPKNQTNGKHNNHKMQKGIAGFFNKPVTSSQKSTINTKNAIEIGEKKKEIKVEKMDVAETKIITESSYKNKTEKENKNMNSNKNDSTLNKTENESKSTSSKKKDTTLNQIKKNSKVDKKRKRVLQVSDSDSEEETDPFTPDKQNVIEDSDDEIPPTPMAENIKITAALVNPKKKRKIIDKTFMDEEGYILTKKVEVYESCSENEEEISTEKKEKSKEVNLSKVKEIKVEVSPKKNKPKNKKNASSPQKGKQATLTNFFKRK